jgi:hypothetical protein
LVTEKRKRERMERQDQLTYILLREVRKEKNTRLKKAFLEASKIRRTVSTYCATALDGSQGRVLRTWEALEPQRVMGPA